MNDSKAQFQFRIVGADRRKQLISMLETLTADGWELKLCFPDGEILLQRPFSGGAGARSELQDIFFADDEY